MSRCIINVALGDGYERGQSRLLTSLGTSNTMTWKGWPRWDAAKSTPYVAKAAALECAIGAGHSSILWLDASAIAAGPLDPIFARADADGLYLPTSGYNCAQTCNDRILDYFGIDRDTAEGIPDAATGCFGVNIQHAIGVKFAHLFIKAARDGMFEGSRLHGGQSKDPRFLFHRQDQSAAGLIAHILGVNTDPMGTLVGYYPAKTLIQFKAIA